MEAPVVASIAVVATTFYLLCGIGTVTLIRNTEKTFPRVLVIGWPILLVLSAFGMFEE